MAFVIWLLLVSVAALAMLWGYAAAACSPGSGNTLGVALLMALVLLLQYWAVLLLWPVIAFVLAALLPPFTSLRRLAVSAALAIAVPAAGIWLIATVFGATARCSMGFY